VTHDVIALTGRMPDARTILAGLLAGGPELVMETAGEGALIQLCDERGRPLVTVEAPMLVSVPGEAARLLGAGAPTAVPVWWTEARAATGVRRAELLAEAFGRRVVTVLGGTVWPTTAAPAAPVPDTSAAPTSVPAASDVTALPLPAAAQPAVDVLTERAAVVIQDRPVVAMTAWLSDALRATVGSGRALQVVTPPDSRLSLPTRTALSGLPNRWVVRDGETCYDGLSGAVLHWHDGAFTPVGAEGSRTPVASACAAASAPTGERQLALSFRTVHPTGGQLLLGGALETAWWALTGGPPQGWGTAEPAGLPWSRARLTELARERAPRSTWLVVVGGTERPAVAAATISRTSEGVEEDVTLAVGFGAEETPPLDVLPELAGTLVADHRLTTALAQLQYGRRDLSVPAALEPPAAPVGFALGPAEVREVGLAFARRPPLPVRLVELGSEAGPGLYCPLGDGDPGQAWPVFEVLLRHLRGRTGAGG
jgi:Family of unknown function (DUF6177)